MSRRILVAGVGNIFFGDDGFGVRVAGRMAAEPMPDGVRVVDFGIRGVHLAYELLNGYDAVVLVDAVPRRGEPGTLHVIEADLDADEPPDPGQGSPVMDAHGMTPDAVLSLLRTLGGSVDHAFVVGCEPTDCSERMELSAPVEESIDEAAALVRGLVSELIGASDRGTDLTSPR